MGWKDVQDEADQLNDIAREIKNRYTKVNTNSIADGVFDAACYPELGDPAMWRIKVQVCNNVRYVQVDY
jgi:hypothetical protein